MALKQDTRLYQIEKLCLDCAPKVLQELSKIYLNGRSLHSHVSSLDIQNFDKKERENIAEMKESSDLSKFDFTKLVFLLLRTFNLTNSDKASLKSLRDIRNKAVHERSANDFEKAEQLLLNLAKSVDERNHKTNIFLETKSKIERLKNTEVKENPRQNKLRERLKQGNKYVTDFFQPLIVTGNITGSSYEEKIRQYLDIDCAFTSAKMVLDFDSTSALRDKTEKGNSIFTVRTAENVYRDKQFGDLLSKHPVWIYCNGYNKSSKTEEHQQQQIREWRKERKKGVNKALEEMKNKYSGILKVIILVYEDCAQNDPLFKITRDMIENDFPDTCDLLIISENDEFISTLKKTSSDYCYSEECEDIFLTGMSWDLVSDEMKTSFRVKTDIDCVLPCRAGNTAIMTRKERSVYTDFDIVSGEECIHEIEGMEMQQRRTKMEETKRNFYIGKGISWWNFYFEGQVGKRCVFEEYCRQIRNKLDNGKHTEKFTLSHNPGAGGTTVGMHILWQFSQFSQANGPQNAYRCCILKKITSTTTQQLVNFCMFKEKENQKPVIVLIDDEQEDAVNDFYDELYDEAKKHSHLKLLCLVVVVKREPTGLNVKIPHTLLTPKLKAEEKMWFDDKYKELEDNYNIEYVNSLISFNFLKNSYEPSVIQKTTDRLIKELKKEEKDILKCLSVIGTFERKRHALPFRVFDVLVERTATKETWNTHLSEAMNLLITETQDEDAVGISVISQPLAKAVLDNFKTVDGINLEFLVDYLLDLIEKNRMNGRYLSQKLRTVIGGLFKREERTGPSATDKDKEKDDFSALIFKLAEQRTNETLECAHKRTVAALQRCFKLTEDPMVGQQVARFYNHICQFSEAIETIKKSIDMKPSSSYLLDTYGHIFKTKMDFLIKQGIAEERKIPDKKASEIIDIAFHAVSKFSEAQMIAYKEHLKSTKRNISCFYNEIRTIMLMLENFKEFESYSTRQDFLKFLNEPSYTLEASRFKSLVELNPKVNDLKQGTDYQVHLMEILQYTRDRTNQIKYYKVDSEEGDLILKFSERLARFYGDSKSTGHCYFTCPIDLKAMMDGLSDKKKRDSMIARVEASKENLESKVVDVDDRDLLVYLGYMIIELSGTLLSSEEKYSEDEYKKLLKYSKCLIESQTQIPGRILLEVFLYHGMLHWPSDTRTEKDLDDFCPPTKYKEYLRKWESNFYSNHSLKTKEQKEKNRAKIFFALGKGRPGNDIINLKVIQQWLRQMQNSSVDEVWDEEIVKEQLKSFRGIVNGEGTAVSHTVTYSQERQSKIDIYMVKHLPELSNREVTFFLGFSWKGPAALGVKDLMTEDEDDSLSPRSIEIDQTADMSDVRDTSFSYNTIEKPSARPKKIQQKIVRAKTVPAGPVMVTDEAYSKTVIERILYDPPDQVVFSCVCQEGSYFRSILLHISPDETYVYSLHKDNQTLLTKGDLIRLFMDKKLHKVFFDIGAISEILIQKHGVLMEGNIWDVKVLVEYLSEQDEDSEDLRKHYRDAKARFDIWSQESSSFCVKLSKEDMDKTVQQSLVTRGNHISEIFGICKSKLDQSLRSSQMSEVRKKIFAIAQPPHLADKIKQIKEQEKQQTQKQKKKEKTPQPSQPQQAKADSKKKQKKKKKAMRY